MSIIETVPAETVKTLQGFMLEIEKADTRIQDKKAYTLQTFYGRRPNGSVIHMISKMVWKCDGQTAWGEAISTGFKESR